MAKQLILVFTNPQEGQEEAYNDWYQNTHLTEMVGSVKGWVKAQRFVLAPEQLEFEPSRHKYLAVYEVEGDLQEAYAGLADGMEDGSITVIDELVKQDEIIAWTYTAIDEPVTASSDAVSAESSAG